MGQVSEDHTNEATEAVPAFSVPDSQPRFARYTGSRQSSSVFGRELHPSLTAWERPAQFRIKTFISPSINQMIFLQIGHR